MAAAPTTDLAEDIGTLGKWINKLRAKNDELESKIAALESGAQRGYYTPYLGPINTIGTQSYVELAQVTSVSSVDCICTPLRTNDSGIMGASSYALSSIKAQVGAAQQMPAIGQVIGAVFVGQEAVPDETQAHYALFGFDTYKTKVSSGDAPGFLFEQFYNTGTFSSTIHTDVFAQIVGSGDAEQIRLYTLLGSGGSLSYTAGCGIDASALGSYEIKVKTSDLAGLGIKVAETPCALDLDLGCGLTFDSNEKVMFDPQHALADDGTPQGGLKPYNESDPDDCRITVFAGCGLTFADPVGGWVPLKFDPDAVAGAGLMPSGDNNSLACKIDIKVGCGLVINQDTNALEFDFEDVAGYGLSIDHESDCPRLKIDIGLGCGLTTDHDSNIAFHADEVAGNGLITSDGCILHVNPGCGIQIVSDAVTFKNTDVAGDGLTTAETCKIKVNVGCGLDIDESTKKLEIKRTDLLGPGIKAGSYPCNLQVDLTETVRSITNVTFDGTDLVLDYTPYQVYGVPGIPSAYTVDLTTLTGGSSGGEWRYVLVEADIAAAARASGVVTPTLATVRYYTDSGGNYSLLGGTLIAEYADHKAFTRLESGDTHFGRVSKNSAGNWSFDWILCDPEPTE